MQVPCVSAVMLLGIHPREKKTSVHIQACTHLFIEASSNLVRLCGLKKKHNYFNCTIAQGSTQKTLKNSQDDFRFGAQNRKRPFLSNDLFFEGRSSIIFIFILSLHFLLKCLMNQRNKVALGIQHCGCLLGMCWKYVARRQNRVVEINFKVVATLL